MHFVVIFGPPAVGKMTVGRLIEESTGIRLFHNHMTIEPVLKYFDFGTPPFLRLVDGFRRRLFEEVVASDLPGLCFTFVWDLDSDSDREFLEAACEPFRARHAAISFVELRAGLAERLRRNRLPDRLRGEAIEAQCCAIRSGSEGAREETPDYRRRAAAARPTPDHRHARQIGSRGGHRGVAFPAHALTRLVRGLINPASLARPWRCLPWPSHG